MDRDEAMPCSSTEPGTPISFEQARALRLLRARKMSYRQVAIRIGRSDRDTLLLLNDALRQVQQLMSAGKVSK